MLKTGDIVVMDNLSSHKIKGFASAINTVTIKDILGWFGWFRKNKYRI